MRIRTEILLLRNGVAFLLLWLVLTGGAADAWIAGVIPAAAATWIAHRMVPPRPWRPLGLLALVPHFAWRSLAGGIDVARRALDPRLPLNPGWVRYPAHLPPGAPQVLLGGEISLQPGTLAAGAQENWLLVHTLDTRLPVGRMVAEEEDRLREALER